MKVIIHSNDGKDPLHKKQHKNSPNLYIAEQFVPFFLQQLCKLALLKVPLG
jgi:hypothetical protein